MKTAARFVTFGYFSWKTFIHRGPVTVDGGWSLKRGVPLPTYESIVVAQLSISTSPARWTASTIGLVSALYIGPKIILLPNCAMRASAAEAAIDALLAMSVSLRSKV